MSDTRRPRKPAKPYRRPQKDPVRILAFEALRAVDERDAYANLVLPPLLRKAREKGDFDGRDAALATELVYGTLRRQGTYEVPPVRASPAVPAPARRAATATRSRVPPRLPRDRPSRSSRSSPRPGRRRSARTATTSWR